MSHCLTRHDIAAAVHEAFRDRPSVAEAITSDPHFPGLAHALHSIYTRQADLDSDLADLCDRVDRVTANWLANRNAPSPADWLRLQLLPTPGRA